MRDRRQQVLDTIQRATEPLGVSEIADHLGVHPNTARFHLETLVGDGIIERVPDPPSGPGRPRVGYRARPGLARGGARRYRELADLLPAHLSATSDAPTAAATAAGRTWGAQLIPRPAPFHKVTPVEAVDRLAAMLDDLDFAPEPVANRPGPPDRIRLRHCPFLELAEPHRDLVCPLHLGLMQGALTELGAPITVTALPRSPSPPHAWPTSRQTLHAEGDRHDHRRPCWRTPASGSPTRRANGAAPSRPGPRGPGRLPARDPARRRRPTRTRPRTIPRRADPTAWSGPAAPRRHQHDLRPGTATHIGVGERQHPQPGRRPRRAGRRGRPPDFA